MGRVEMRYLRQRQMDRRFVLDAVAPTVHHRAWTDVLATAVRDLQKWSLRARTSPRTWSTSRRWWTRRSRVRRSRTGRSSPPSGMSGGRCGLQRVIGARGGAEVLRMVGRGNQVRRGDVKSHRTLRVVVDRQHRASPPGMRCSRARRRPSPAKSGTFKDCERRLPEIAAMGFDVVYLPPVHPIGRTNRRGRNNSPTRGPARPGEPVGHRQRTEGAQGDPP